MPLLLLVPAALAADPDPTAARPVETHHSAVSGVMATPLAPWGGQATLSASLGGALRVDQGLGARMFVHGSAEIVGGLGSFQGMLGGRLVEEDAIRVAAYGGVAGTGAPDGVGTLGPALGLAVDAGTRDVRIEASLPVAYDLASGRIDDRPWLLGSAGVRWMYTGHQQVRVGVDPGLVATASWTYVADHWHLGAGAGYYGSGPLAHLSVGATW